MNPIVLTYLCISSLSHHPNSNSSKEGVITVGYGFVSSFERSRPTYGGINYLCVTGHLRQPWSREDGMIGGYVKLKISPL